MEQLQEAITMCFALFVLLAACVFSAQAMVTQWVSKPCLPVVFPVRHGIGCMPNVLARAAHPPTSQQQHCATSATRNDMRRNGEPWLRRLQSRRSHVTAAMSIASEDNAYNMHVDTIEIMIDTTLLPHDAVTVSQAQHMLGMHLSALNRVRVTPESPAAHAGLRSHDVVVAVDGVPVRDCASTMRCLARSALGSSHGSLRCLRILRSHSGSKPAETTGITAEQASVGPAVDALDLFTRVFGPLEHALELRAPRASPATPVVAVVVKAMHGKPPARRPTVHQMCGTGRARGYHVSMGPNGEEVDVGDRTDAADELVLMRGMAVAASVVPLLVTFGSAFLLERVAW